MAKKFFMAMVIVALCVCNANAYFIGNRYVTLIDCSYGQYGYKYGFIGTYKDSSGNLYRIFFGSNYCQH